MKPRVVAGVGTAFTGRRECQRPAQCHEVVIWSDEAHDVRHVFFAGSPSVQAQEQRMRGMLVEAAARGDAVLHGEWLAKTSGHSGWIRGRSEAGWHSLLCSYHSNIEVLRAVRKTMDHDFNHIG